MQETNRIEFKRELNNRLERSIVSFMNYPGGGEILLGVDDNGSSVGVADIDATQLKIINRIRNNIKPQTLGLFDVIKDEIDGKDIIRVIVSCGQQRPYYIRKYGMTEHGCLIRVGNSSQPMTEQMIEELISKRQQISLQSMISPRKDLSFKQLCIYYEEMKLMPTEQFIESLDLRQSTEKIIGKIRGKVKTTLDVIKDDPTATIVKLSELTSKSQSTISRELKEYQAAGLLRREGSRKKGQWVVE